MSTLGTQNVSPLESATGAFAVTPSNSVNFTQNARALYIGVSGDVAVVMLSDEVVTFKAAPVGILPIQCKRVNVTNTTATNILGLYI